MDTNACRVKHPHGISVHSCLVSILLPLQAFYLTIMFVFRQLRQYINYFRKALLRGQNMRNLQMLYAIFVCPWAMETVR